MSDDPKDPAEGQDNPEEVRPAWLPENFKEPEALVESYKEAQRKITELTGQVKTRDENLQSFSERLEQIEAETSRQSQQTQQYDFQAAYDRAYEEGDTRAIIALNAQLAQAAAEQAFQKLQPQQPASNDSNSEIVAKLAEAEVRARYGDWDDYREKIADTIKAQPWLLPDEALSSPRRLEAAFDNVYRIVKFDDQGTAGQGNQAAELQRQMKLQAQSAVGAAGRPGSPDSDKEAWERIKAARPKNYWE